MLLQTFLTRSLKIRDDENRSQREASFNHNAVFICCQTSKNVRWKRRLRRRPMFAKIRKTDIFFRVVQHVLLQLIIAWYFFLFELVLFVEKSRYLYCYNINCNKMINLSKETFWHMWSSLPKDFYVTQNKLSILSYYNLPALMSFLLLKTFYKETKLKTASFLFMSKSNWRKVSHKDSCLFKLCLMKNDDA